MGDGYKPPPVGDQTRDSIQALAKYLPEYLNTVNASIVPTEQANFEAAQKFSPLYYQLQLDNYKKYGAELEAQAAAQARANQIAATQNDIATIDSGGSALAAKALELQRQTDPEYFANREALGAKLLAAQSALDPSGALTGSERSEIERGLARDVGRNRNSAINTVENAIQYGNASNQRRADVNNQLSQIANNLGALRTGADVFGIATGRQGLTGNQGQLMFGQGYKENSGQGQALAAGLGDQTLDIQKRNVAARAAGFRTLGDQIEQGTRAFSNVLSSVSGVMR